MVQGCIDVGIGLAIAVRVGVVVGVDVGGIGGISTSTQSFHFFQKLEQILWNHKCMYGMVISEIVWISKSG